MTHYIWTGESEYCTCGHHLTDHETLQWPISLTEHPIVICKGEARCAFGSSSKRFLSGCHCDEFRPYRTRILGEDDNQVIEKQTPEVTRK
jgi:hypothetical protein